METITTPTESQIQVLMSDWLGNLRMKGDRDFTHSGEGGIRRSAEGGFSDYLVGNVSSYDDLELLKQARVAAKQVVNAIVPEAVDVKVGGAGSYQDEDEYGRKVVNLATDYFDDHSISKRQKVDIMLGLASHEAAHAVFTDPGIMKERLMKEPPQTRELKKTIWNILEDERIEYMLGDERPGLAETLGATKNYFFKKLVKDMRTNGQMPTEPLPKLLSALTQAVRYPSEMTREQVTENFDELDAIRKALTPYPLTDEDTWKATGRVMDIVKKIVEDKLEQEQQQSHGGQQPQGGQNQSQSGSQDPDGQQGPQGGQNTQIDPQSQEPGPSEKDVLDAIKKALETEQGRNVMDALRKDESKSDGRNSASDISRPQNAKTDYVNEDDAESIAGGPGNPRVFLFKPKGSASRYATALQAVRKYIPAMSKALACKSRDTHYVLHGLPSGKLNTNKLVALSAGNVNIFDKQGQVTCSSASVCMLIDESGSMSGTKEQRAREAAVLVNETISRIPNVNFYCYGFTDDRLTVYAENGRTSKWALSDTGSHGGTPTGMAMRLAAARLRRFTKDPILMLVLTDGAADNTREVVLQDESLRKDKFIPVGVGIQSSSVRYSFKEWIVVEDISTFALDLGKLTKGKLDTMLVRRDA